MYVVAEMRASVGFDMDVAFKTLDKAIEYCQDEASPVICSNKEEFENWQDETGFAGNQGNWDYGVFEIKTGEFLFAIQEVKLQE